MNRVERSALRRPRVSRALGLAVGSLAGALVAFSSVEPAAQADPLRLRADAYAQTDAPVGMLVVHGDDQVMPWVDAEAVAWLGFGDNPNFLSGDVQTLTVRVRDPEGRGEVRVGRFLETAGALMPEHIDGVRALGRIASTGTTMELFGGAPVVPEFGARQFDYIVGGRIGQSVSDWLSFGLSYATRRNDGQLLDQEFGPDVLFAPARWFDLAARASFDLVHTSPTEANVSMGFRKGDLRLELFSTHRDASRLLPATSLFTVLGDHPATTSGGTVTYRAAPRLQLVLTGAGIYQNTDPDYPGDTTTHQLGAYATGRATLALDDKAAGSLGVELRRWSVATAQWWGARFVAIVPIVAKVRASTELEIVRFDDVPDTTPPYTGSTNKFRPWGLFALSYSGMPRWDFAGALEYSRTRDDRNEYNAMARATYAFEQPK